MNRTVYLVVTLIVVSLSGCRSYVRASSRDKELVGLWLESSEYTSAVVLRMEDGTFLEKRVQAYDLSKPAVTINCAGKWRLNKGYYIVQYEKASNPLWKSAIGKSIQQRILSLKLNQLQYESKDGAIVTESKKGPPSQLAFEHAVVELPDYCPARKKEQEKTHMKRILHWLFVFDLVVHVWAQNPDSVQDQIEKNRVDMGSEVLSPDGYWKLSMIRETEDGPYTLVISHGNFQKKVTESSKPDNRVCWSSDLRYMVIVKPVGFCTMADLFRLDRERNQITEVFCSEKTNQRQFIDYLFQRWDMERGAAIFDVRENPRYLEGRKPRLFATEYVYLDGDNGFESKE